MMTAPAPPDVYDGWTTNDDRTWHLASWDLGGSWRLGTRPLNEGADTGKSVEASRLNRNETFAVTGR